MNYLFTLSFIAEMEDESEAFLTACQTEIESADGIRSKLIANGISEQDVAGLFTLIGCTFQPIHESAIPPRITKGSQ